MKPNWPYFSIKKSGINPMNRTPKNTFFDRLIHFMLNVNPASILEIEAYMWNGKQKLPGKLILTNEELEFVLKGFEDSRFSWTISRKDIQHARDFLVYNIVRQGLKVVGKDGITDMFVLEDKTDLNKILKVLNQQD